MIITVLHQQLLYLGCYIIKVDRDRLLTEELVALDSDLGVFVARIWMLKSKDAVLLVWLIKLFVDYILQAVQIAVISANWNDVSTAKSYRLEDLWGQKLNFAIGSVVLLESVLRCV